MHRTFQLRSVNIQVIPQHAFISLNQLHTVLTRWEECRFLKDLTHNSRMQNIFLSGIAKSPGWAYHLDVVLITQAMLERGHVPTYRLTYSVMNTSHSQRQMKFKVPVRRCPALPKQGCRPSSTCSSCCIETILEYLQFLKQAFSDAEISLTKAQSFSAPVHTRPVLPQHGCTSS